MQELKVAKNISKSTPVPEQNVLNLKKIFAEKEALARKEAQILAQAAELKIKREQQKIWPKLKKVFKRKIVQKRLPVEKQLNMPQPKLIKKHSSLKPQKWVSAKYHFSLPKLPNLPVLPKMFKPWFSFILICLILISPFASSAFYQQLISIKNGVMAQALSGITDLKAGGLAAAASEYPDAEAQFTSAGEAFSMAHAELDKINNTLGAVIKVVPGKGEELTTAENLIIAGENISGAAVDINKVLDIFNNFNLESYAKSPDAEIGLTTVIMVAHSALQPAVEKIQRADTALGQVDLEVVPSDYVEQIKLAQATLPILDQQLSQSISTIDTLLTLLGHQTDKKYLVLFQNNHELRATGGFLGSLALIDLDKGKITGLEIPGGGIYDLAGQFEEKIMPPAPLHLVNPYWELQDANWWPDFPTSAKKILWFYEQSKGEPVDGIITLTPGVVEELLDLTGPIDLTAQYGVEISADNFYQVVQTEAEKKYAETQTSKQIIADLTPLLMQKLFTLSGDKILSALALLQTKLTEKDILVYVTDDNLEQELINLGWAGEIKATDGDYLSVIDTNIGGGKSDGAIKETITQTTEIKADGSIIDTVKIKRKHNAVPEDQFAYINNWDYLRVYVPLGSVLLSATGFVEPDQGLIITTDDGYTIDEDLQQVSGQITQHKKQNLDENTEFGKTVFAGWVETKVEGESEVTLSYRIPDKIATKNFFDATDTYSLFIQKQPGSWQSVYNTRLILPQNYTSIWQTQNNLTTGASGVLNTDKFFGAVIKVQ